MCPMSFGFVRIGYTVHPVTSVFYSLPLVVVILLFLFILIPVYHVFFLLSDLLCTISDLRHGFFFFFFLEKWPWLWERSYILKGFHHRHCIISIRITITTSSSSILHIPLHIFHVSVFLLVLNFYALILFLLMYNIGCNGCANFLFHIVLLLKQHVYHM